MRTRLLALLVGFLAVSAALGDSARAQTYAQEDNPTNCVEPFDEEEEDVVTTFAAGEVIFVEGNPDLSQFCGTPGSTATVLMASDPVVLAVTTIDSLGGYSTEEAVIPRDTTNGTHSIIVRTTLNGQSVEYTRAITVSGGSARGADGLPLTGTNAVLLALWALTLTVFGSVLISVTWKRWREARLHVVTGFVPTEPAGPLMELLDRRPDELRPASTAAIPVAGRAQEQSALSTAPALIPSMVAELAEPLDALAAFDAPSGTDASDVQQVVERASERTSDLVSRLQDEIKAWSAPAER